MVTLTVDLSASDFIDTEPIATENEGNSENVILGIGEIKTQTLPQLPAAAFRIFLIQV